jgi:hypothetical protein
MGRKMRQIKRRNSNEIIALAIKIWIKSLKTNLVKNRKKTLLNVFLGLKRRK